MATLSGSTRLRYRVLHGYVIGQYTAAFFAPLHFQAGHDGVNGRYMAAFMTQVIHFQTCPACSYTSQCFGVYTPILDVIHFQMVHPRPFIDPLTSGFASVHVPVFLCVTSFHLGVHNIVFFVRTPPC